MSSSNIFEELLGNYSGIDGKGYHCNRCKYGMEKIVVQTISQTPRKLFYCTRKTCERYGMLTVVAIVKGGK